MRNDHLKNEEVRQLKIKFVTPGYNHECGSVKKLSIKEEQEDELYRLYRRFADDVFAVLRRKNVEACSSIKIEGE